MPDDLEALGITEADAKLARATQEKLLAMRKEQPEPAAKREMAKEKTFIPVSELLKRVKLPKARE